MGTIQTPWLSRRPYNAPMAGAVLVIVTILIVLGIQKLTYVPFTLPREYRENSPQYTYTNPLLYMETDDRMYTEYDAYDKRITSYVEQAKNTHTADSVSVYLRDMRSGHWTGYNIDEQYEPSSMLKVAVMIAYLRSAVSQSDKSEGSIDSYLAERIYYPGANDRGQYYIPEVHLPAGYYSYRDLIRNMIVYSDNSSMYTLLAHNQTEYNNVYKDFRLPAPIDGGTADYMTARSYSVIFRTLYNSTYLPWDVSENALQLLASTTFSKGLVAGLPTGLNVSHKFGEHTNVLVDGTLVNHELHDCGIIYYPKHPYFLCVMTKGSDFPSLEKVISGISLLTYQTVDSRYSTTTVK